MRSLVLRKFVLAMAAMTLGLSGAMSPTLAQITEVDPNDAIDADLGSSPGQSAANPALPVYDDYTIPPEDEVLMGQPVPAQGTVPASDVAQGGPPDPVPADGTTYQEDDLIGAAEGVFGKGAEGLGRLIEDILSKQGEPNAYIVGREGGGAFIVGLRYGSGTLFHKIEGEQPVYWTGPSIGFDAGANAGSTFILVYNLYDSEELYKRYVAGEGAAYLVGGFNASYMRRGDKVLIPIRLGVGLRLGVNAGYMKFSRKQRWLPF